MGKIHLEQIDTNHIRQQLESGEYFVQARVWYNELYLKQLGERSFFVVITLLAALTIFLSLVVYSSMYPLTRSVPYTIIGNNESMYEDTPFIRHIREVKGEDINVSMSRFLMKNYVATREKYKYDVIDIERRFSRIRATTADAEFLKYQNETSPENPSSPTNKYGRNATREVLVQRVDLNLAVTPPQAKVYYATLLNAGTGKQINQWLATITFRFPSVKVDQSTNKVLQKDETSNQYTLMGNVNFEVLEYATQEISNAAQQ